MSKDDNFEDGGSPVTLETFHASSVAMDGGAVILRGPSGSGKSDLALRLINQGVGRLIADDQSIIQTCGNDLIVSSPPQLHGRLEVRGLGIIQVEPAPPMTVGLVVDLVDKVERLPELRSTDLLGQKVAHWLMIPFESSAVAKLAQAWRQRRDLWLITG